MSEYQDRRALCREHRDAINELIGTFAFEMRGLLLSIGFEDTLNVSFDVECLQKEGTLFSTGEYLADVEPIREG